MICKCRALAFVPLFSTAVAERHLGLAQLPQMNFITRNRGCCCPVYDRLPSATALYGACQEARMEEQ
jgi:hypothetical protein